MLLVGSSSASSIFSGKAPTPDWAVAAAKLPTPASAADARAIILLDDTIVTVDEQGHAVEHERTVTRILKPQGRDEGVCVAQYSEGTRINLLRAWTITAEGRQMQALEADTAEFGDTSVPTMLSTNKARVAHPPGVDPGASVACETEVTIPAYIQEENWEVQHRIPVLAESLELDLPAARKYSDSWRDWPAVKPTEIASNHFKWQVADIPALDLREIPAAPHWGALNGRMTIQWGDAAVADKDTQWHAICAWMDRLEAHRPDPTPEIRAKAQELVAGAPDFYTRLSRIAEYVQKDFRYFVVMRGIGGLQANPADQIFHNRYGDCKDKSTITISLLASIDIPAHYVFVDTNRGIVDPENPSLIGNHMITAIELPADLKDPRLQAVVTAKSGKRYLIFDPTNQRTAIGTLPAYLQGGYGGLADGAGSQLIPLPVLDAKVSGTDQKGVFTLAADGTLSGSVQATHLGPEGGDWRYLIKETDEKERHDLLEHRIGRQIPGVTLDSYKFVEPDHLDQPLELHYQVTAHQYARAMGQLLLVRPHVVGEDTISFDNKPRTLPIALESTGHWHDSFDIALPDGYLVDELPDPASIDTDFASYHSSFKVDGRTLHYERDYTVHQLQLPPEKAAEFRKLQGTILADERATAVLKKQ